MGNVIEWLVPRFRLARRGVGWRCVFRTHAIASAIWRAAANHSGKPVRTGIQKILKLQLDAFKALQRLTRRDGETLCVSLESAEHLGVQKFLDLKAIEPLLTPQQRELLGAFGIDLSKVDVAKIMRLLGVDLSHIDLRQLKQQCRASKGELDRFATSELNRVESEISRCDGRV